MTVCNICQYLIILRVVKGTVVKKEQAIIT